MPRYVILLQPSFNLEEDGTKSEDLLQRLVNYLPGYCYPKNRFYMCDGENFDAVFLSSIEMNSHTFEKLSNSGAVIHPNNPCALLENGVGISNGKNYAYGYPVVINNSISDGTCVCVPKERIAISAFLYKIEEVLEVLKQHEHKYKIIGKNEQYFFLKRGIKQKRKP